MPPKNEVRPNVQPADVVDPPAAGAPDPSAAGITAKLARLEQLERQLAPPVRVRMRTTSAGPDGVRHVDVEYDVRADEARELVDGGYAVFCEAKPHDATKPM